MAIIVGIFTSPAKGFPMQAIRQVQAIARVGLEGDRYALSSGTYSQILNRRLKVENFPSDARPVRHVTFISKGAIDTANRELEIPFNPIETRRNLLVDHISSAELLALIDREFTIGSVRMRGFEDCIPCALPGNLANKHGFKDAFANCAGLRAEILTSGTISVGDELAICDET